MAFLISRAPYPFLLVTYVLVIRYVQEGGSAVDPESLCMYPPVLLPRYLIIIIDIFTLECYNLNLEEGHTIMIHAKVIIIGRPLIN